MSWTNSVSLAALTDSMGIAGEISKAVVGGCDEAYTRNINHCWASRKEEEYPHHVFFLGDGSKCRCERRDAHSRKQVGIVVASLPVFAFVSTRKNSFQKFIKWALKAKSKRKIIYRFSESLSSCNGNVNGHRWPFTSATSTGHALTEFHLK